MQGPVGRIVGQIKEKGFFLFHPSLANEAHGHVGESVGGVKPRPWIEGVIHEGQPPGRLRIHEVRSSGDDSEIFVKAPLQRPIVGVMIPQVPLARHQGVIATCLKHLGQSGALLVEVALVRLIGHGARGFRGFGHVPNPCLVRVKPCHEAGSRGAASAGIIKLGETQAALSQRVEMRRANFPSVATDVGITHIIHQNHDDVGPLPLLGVDVLHASIARQNPAARP